VEESAEAAMGEGLVGRLCQTPSVGRGDS
jgi:hypothetical protein